ncbi:MAG: hypothetical protein JWL77_654 [Chthonomonadaceae bacterium]|nr:hypothetical protein [Chthonomonadaceae bacterium]
MRLNPQAVLGFVLTACALSGAIRPALADPPATAKVNLKPDVAALIKQSTDIYKKMKSYRHTALFVAEFKNPMNGQAVKREQHYTLALERPNKFAYKNDTQPTAAAVSDGKTFINFKGDETGEKLQYTRQNAPADFKGINIVDDVTFEPLATYVIALMLQGDPLADKDVRAALEKASLKPGTVTENGKKWQVLTMPFDQQEMTEIYFNAEDHLIGKSVQRIVPQGVKIVETYENVSVNKPIDAAVFQYTPPANAKRIEKFVPVQKPDDARNTPTHSARPVLTRIPANHQPKPRIA